jgi:hypothetical protein
MDNSNYWQNFCENGLKSYRSIKIGCNTEQVYLNVYLRQA